MSKLSPQQKAARTRAANKKAAERADREAAKAEKEKAAMATDEPVVDTPGVEKAGPELNDFIKEQKQGQQANEDAAAAAGGNPPSVGPSDVPDEPTAVEHTIYISKTDFHTHVKVGDKKVPIHFQRRTFYANEAEARTAGCSLVEFVATIEAHDRYNMDFIKSAGPGFVKTERVIRWARLNSHYDPDREMRVYKGSRSTRNRA